MKRLIAFACAATLGACASTATSPEPETAPPPPAASAAAWVGAWSAAPAPPTESSPDLNNQTIRQVARLGASGDRIRIRLDNTYGNDPLNVGAASISLIDPIDGADGTPIALTFNGASSVSIPRGSPMLSDPVEVAVASGSDIALRIYFPEATGPCTCHPLAVANTEVSGEGDFTTVPFVAEDTFTNRAFFSGVEVYSDNPPNIIVAFGDSITDGYGSTVDGNARWPDVLRARFAPESNLGIVNAAISGNRVLGYGLEMFGEPALARLNRDVLTIPGAKWIVMLEGVNDVGMGRGEGPSAAELINGYSQVISRAHDEGIKVIGATILPYKNAGYYTEAGDAVRREVNEWMRTGGAFDGVIDFDEVMRDPSDPAQMRPDLHVGDWLHPNDAGYRVMGEAIDLALFN